MEEVWLTMIFLLAGLSQALAREGKMMISVPWLRLQSLIAGAPELKSSYAWDQMGGNREVIPPCCIIPPSRSICWADGGASAKQSVLSWCIITCHSNQSSSLALWGVQILQWHGDANMLSVICYSNRSCRSTRETWLPVLFTVHDLAELDKTTFRWKTLPLSEQVDDFLFSIFFFLIGSKTASLFPNCSNLNPGKHLKHMLNFWYVSNHAPLWHST